MLNPQCKGGVNKDTLSLRNDIVPYPNIEVEIDIVDKTPFFIQPYHVREEVKQILDKGMKRSCHVGILKERFSAYSSPVMLVSRKTDDR